MAARKIPPEVQKIFDKYIHNNVRNLKKDAAIAMMMSEFSLEQNQAEEMFDSFDRDKNGIMSIWEFQAFYACVGGSAQQMIDKFKEIDKDGSGKLDADEAREGLKSIEMGGRHLEDREIEFFIKSSIGDDGVIDLGEFANLLFKLKMYEKKQAQQAQKKKK